MTACYEMLLYGREALLGRQAHRATPGVWSALPSTSARDTERRAMSDGKREWTRERAQSHFATRNRPSASVVPACTISSCSRSHSLSSPTTKINSPSSLR